MRQFSFFKRLLDEAPAHQRVESVTDQSTSGHDLENDVLCKVFAPGLPQSLTNKQDPVKSGEKNDAKYVQRQMENQRRASVNNPFKLAVEKTRFWGQKEKKRSIVNLRQALDLNYGHEFDESIDGHSGNDTSGGKENAILVKQDSLFLEGERISLSENKKIVTIEVTNIKLRGIASASYFSKPKPYVVFQCAETREKT